MAERCMTSGQDMLDVAQKRQLYNRQEYVVGAETQQKYESTSVLVVGACGVGAEVIKNLVLTGVGSVGIHDEARVELADLGTNFFLHEDDIGRQRGAAVAQAAKELNRFVRVTAVGGDVLRLIPTVHVVLFVNHPIVGLVEANDVARAHGVKFVACESHGIAGCVFVDAGPSFDVLDPDGEETVSCVVTAMSSDGLVTLQDDKSHECEVGSKVYFTGLAAPAVLNTPDGAPQLRLFEVREVISPCVLSLRDFPSVLRGEGVAGGGQPPVIEVGTSAYMHTTKRRLTLSFQSLRDSLAAPRFVEVFDSAEKLDAPATLHAVFCAAGTHSARGEGRATVDELLRSAQALQPMLNVKLAADVLRVYAGDLNPMACFVGGMAAQEVLKVCSGKFTPIQQWLYYDARELLSAARGDDAAAADDAAVKGDEAALSRFAGQMAVLGQDFQRYLQTQRVFIVGAGALGCEHIKNVALMGLGAVSITDMDQIEMSNLSRQFLFRYHHIGRPKSLVAAEAARAIYPAIEITAYEEKVDTDTEGVFNESFWGRHEVVLNALDNITSRKYVDGRCLFYKKPLFESGTLGTKCNMQPVIPFVTESYSNSYDPPEKAIPLCTLKNFPNAIEHTIQWARDQFHLLFHNTPQDVNRYLDDPAGFADALSRDPASAPEVLRHVNEALRRWPATAQDCVRLARLLYQEYFHDNFVQLLHNLPLDKRNEDGQLFWSGAKKPPTPQTFRPDSALDADFIYHCACLLAESYGVVAPTASSHQQQQQQRAEQGFPLTSTEAASLAAAVAVPSYAARNLAVTAAEAEQRDLGVAVQRFGRGLELADLPSAVSFGQRRMQSLEFEKDDLTNHHVQFITYASNLRAQAYGIPAADLHRTRRIAGNIIPAMVTTTSLVTGLVGFEMLKFLLLQWRHDARGGEPHPSTAVANSHHVATLSRAVARTPYVPRAEEVPRLLSLYRSAFVNIALPFIAFSDPVIAAGREYALPSGRTLRWSAWDRIDVDEGRDISVLELVQVLQSRYELDVFMITLTSGKMLFTQFGGNMKDKAAPVSVVAVQKGEELQAGNDYLNLIASGMIGDEEDVDIPIIRYKFRNFG